MKIEYVTGNRQKFEEAQHVLEGFELEQVDLDLIEIQGEMEEIIIAKAKEALRILKRPLVVEDVSLCCSALKGLPGPYTKDFLRKMSEEGLYELIHKFDDHAAQAICIAAYIEPGKEPVFFKGVLEGQIVSPLGTTKHGKYSWNRIFRPHGSTKNYGEFSLKELSAFSMRRKALIQLAGYLTEKRVQDL